MSSVMYARRAADPLNATATSPAKGAVFTAATFHYSEDTGLRKDSETHPSASSSSAQYLAGYHNHNQPEASGAAANMASYAAAPSPPSMFVRALYDYDADDQTSLSFRQGQIIQVITQLESGWWDGIINNVRGWFPSNYCQLIPSPDEFDHDRINSIDSDASATDNEWEESDDVQPHTDRINNMSFNEPVERGEEAAFWIPQATDDGRLYYYNTLTGVATPEIPHDDPTTPEETGPRDTMNIIVPLQTKAPQTMADSYDHEEDDASASEVDESFLTRRKTRQRRSYISPGASPTASMEDLNSSGFLPRNQSTDFHRQDRSASMANGAGPSGSFIGEYQGRQTSGVAKQSYYDDAATPPVNWNRLVENMQRAVAAYRDAVNNAERSEYVRKAEDISDHLRMLLAAGSGTTDNHSGNPSIISTNRALYPHFRDMMSKFSKLVLSSHIAAADWPAPDSYSKCLQEAEGVLQGVYGYVEIARRQRGDDVPRLRPGFVLGSTAGGSWRSPDDIRLAPTSSLSTSYIEHEDDTRDHVHLDSHALERLDELRSGVTLNLTRLDAHLLVREKVISNTQHEQISSALCNSAGSVVESFKSYIAGVENLDIKGIRAQETQVATFLTQKQVLYDLIANLVVSCQTVAGPLGDEWSEIRGDPFETRLQAVKTVSKQLETALTQITSTLHGILELSISDSPNRLPRQSDGGATNRMRSGSRPYQGLDDEQEVHQQRNTAKIARILGTVPAPVLAREYLSLDYEGEIAFDTKTDPPQIRGGTLTALVEQLTRHDRMNPSFNNTFLLTYRSFTSAQEIFEMLVKRFAIQPPQGMNGADHQEWVERKQKLVRFRVVNVLKTWIENYWLEPNDETSNDLLRRILNFATDHVASTNTGGAQPLKVVIETRLRGDTAAATKRFVLNLNTQAPSPIVPKNLKKLKFLDIDPLEFARQLTILESRAYGKIKPFECLNKTWQKKVKPNEADPAPNVRALIMQSNQLTNWVAEMILTQSDVRKRVAVIKHFVNIAEKCRSLNNFSTLTSITTALNTASIHRLNRTWGQVSQKTLNALEALRKVMASTKNFVGYRETLHLANPPCIPFFGVYLTDLTFIEDGIPSVIKKTNLINFSKRARTAEVIRDIQQYQNVPYPLQPVNELQNYIIENMRGANDVHEMYNRSLQIEPREREDEKIARLLSESGFL